MSRPNAKHTFEKNTVDTNSLLSSVWGSMAISSMAILGRVTAKLLVNGAIIKSRPMASAKLPGQLSKSGQLRVTVKTHSEDKGAC